MNGENDILLVSKLSDKATIPTKGSVMAAGYDLYSAHDYILKSKGKIVAQTDIQVKVPSGTYGRIAPRSSIAWKHHIDIGAGVIDADYRGNVGIVMFNHSDEDFCVKAGDKIAQLICEKISYPELKILSSLEETERGDKGFGSSGAN